MRLRSPRPGSARNTTNEVRSPAVRMPAHNDGRRFGQGSQALLVTAIRGSWAGITTKRVEAIAACPWGLRHIFAMKALADPRH
jgi:hypothetical protein